MSASEPTPDAARRPSLLVRTLRRRWIPMLTQWAILATALTIWAYLTFPPLYEATAWLKVNPPSNLRTTPQTSPSADAMGQLLETQVQLITSPDVLAAAALHPKIMALPRIRASRDPEKELSKELKAGIAKNTHLILVSMASESPDEAATIVNTVLNAYLKASTTWTGHETRMKIIQLRELQKKFELDQQRHREKLKVLQSKMVQNRTTAEELDRLTSEQANRLKAELTDAEIARLKAEAQLAVLRKRQEAGPASAGREAKIEDLEAQLAASVAVDQAVRQRLASTEIAAGSETSAALSVEFVRNDLKYTDDLLDTINRNLDQIEFDAQGVGARIQLISMAKVAAAPTHNVRPWLMAGIPLGLLVASVLFFMAVEAYSSRLVAARAA